MWRENSFSHLAAHSVSDPEAEALLDGSCLNRLASSALLSVCIPTYN